MAQDPQVTNTGLFITYNPIYDVAQLQELNVNSDEFKELLIRLYFTIGDLITANNLKTTGYYLNTEFNTGQQLFSSTNNFGTTRPIFRTVVNFGALPAAGSKSVNHGIANIGSTYSFVKIYGAASDVTGNTYIPLPYDSTVAVSNSIQVDVNATQVTITTGTDRSNYTVSYVILEYIQF